MSREKQKKPQVVPRRVKGIESPHTVWIRHDLWIRMKEIKLETGKSLKTQMGEALFDYLAKNDLEKRTGIRTEYNETTYDPEIGTVRKEELGILKRED